MPEVEAERLASIHSHKHGSCIVRLNPKEGAKVRLEQAEDSRRNGQVLAGTMCDRMPDRRPGVSKRLSQRERRGRRKSASRGRPQKVELEVPAPSSMRGPGGSRWRQSGNLIGSGSKERKG